MKPTLALAAAAGALLLLGNVAQAQYALSPGAVPPPPSLRDTAKPADGQRTQRRARKPADGAAGTEAQAALPRGRLRTPSSPAAAGGGYSGRIDTRQGSGGLELEDDPRAVQPTFNNGRPGVGMRF